MARMDEYATGADDLILILRATTAARGRREVGAQHRVSETGWCGCTLIAVIDERCTIEIANGDTFNVLTKDVRIPLAS